MKAIKFSLVAAFAAVMMLTSCLNQDNEAEFTRYGVVKVNSEGLPLFYYSDEDYPVYVPDTKYADLSTGTTYVYARPKINYDKNENKVNTARVRGYYVGDKIEIYQDNIDYTESKSLTDANSDKKLTNEIPITGLTELNFAQSTIVTGLSVTLPTNSTVEYLFQFDPYQEPTQEDLSSTSKVNIYDIYLRVVTTSSGGTTMDKTYSHAFPISSYYTEMLANNSNNKEVGGYYIRLNYVTSINNETGEVKWNKNLYFPFYVSQY